MSDLMAVLDVNGDQLVCIDYDKPVWHSKKNPNLRATPSLDHFVVDGLLACLDNEILNEYGIKQRFITEDFQSEPVPYELKIARDILYQAKELKLSYFHDFEGDSQIHEDLARFKKPIIKVEGVSTQNLIELSK
jgi:hypothetical protein